MAKNLTQFVKSITSGGGAYLTTSEHIWEYAPGRIGQCACNYCADMSTWCVPPGISQAKFEIWGAGGYASGICNCSFSIPGSAGAYAYKTIPVTPGECYQVKVGVRRCCFAQQDCTGWLEGTVRDSDHGNTWVQGTGLTNFCAQGGYHAGAYCCTFSNYATSLVDSSTPLYTGQDSALGPNRACYYGADGGVRGIKGYVTHNGLGISNHCNIRFWVPFPGGTEFSTEGGHIQVAACCNQSTPEINHRMWGVNAEQGYCWTVSMSQGGGHWQMFGTGGVGGVTCGGNCYCGSLNDNGKVKITYS